MLNTLGDLITAAMIILGVPVVLYKLVKAWLWPVVRPLLMSRSQDAPPRKNDMDAVSISVSDTSIKTDTDWQLPRISAYLTDQEFLVFLARQKLRDGTYRLSANDLYRIIGGNRNDVLDIVRQIRQTPEYREIPDQAARAA